MELGEPSVWQVSSEAILWPFGSRRCQDESSYIVKSLSGFLLLTDGKTLISCEDPYREPQELFWSLEASEPLTLLGRRGSRPLWKPLKASKVI